MALRSPNGRWRVTLLPTGDWHPEEIKAAVRMRGSTFEQLSRDAGLADFACRMAARNPHYEGERAIAQFLALKPRQIWPSRFRADGSRIPRVRNCRKSTPAQVVGHRQNREAALT